jgi:hypothetical protein
MAYRHIRRREHSSLSPRKEEKLAAELHHQKEDRCSECGGRWGQHQQFCSQVSRSQRLAREYEESH